METGMNQQENKFDVVFMGGGMAASMLSLQLIRKKPSLRIAIVERSEVFPRKVGESSSDITGLFLRSLDIAHVMHDQIDKAGLRFLFNEKNTTAIDDLRELSSPSFKGPTNGWHLNRSVLDDRMLKECAGKGITVYRPAAVVGFVFKPYNSTLEVELNEKRFEFSARWVIDASGNARFVHKQMKWEDEKIGLNTGSVLAHFENLQPPQVWDVPETAFWKKHAIGPKGHSTIHFVRPHSWWWHIKIDEKTTSLGMVFDKRKYSFEDATKFFDDYIANDTQLTSLTRNSKRTEVRHLPHLPYVSSKLYDEGLALVGDAGAFIDPLFSPGLEMICQQTFALCDLLIGDFDNKPSNKRDWKKYERRFINAYKDRAFMYEQGYKYMGSYDLFSNWTQIGMFGYFALSVFPSVVKLERLKKPFVFTGPSRAAYRLLVMRFDSILKRRARQGRTSSSRIAPVSFTYVAIPYGWKFYTRPLLLFWLWGWNYVKLECTEFASLFRRKRPQLPLPQTATDVTGF